MLLSLFVRRVPSADARRGNLRFDVGVVRGSVSYSDGFRLLYGLPIREFTTKVAGGGALVVGRVVEVTKFTVSYGML